MAKYATQAMICAKAVLDSALNQERRAPRQGLAIDFALTGMGFALSQIFALGASLILEALNVSYHIGWFSPCLVRLHSVRSAQIF